MPGYASAHIVRTAQPFPWRLGDESMMDMVGGAAQCEEPCIIGVPHMQACAKPSPSANHSHVSKLRVLPFFGILLQGFGKRGVGGSQKALYSGMMVQCMIHHDKASYADRAFGNRKIALSMRHAPALSRVASPLQIVQPCQEDAQLPSDEPERVVEQLRCYLRISQDHTARSISYHPESRGFVRGCRSWRRVAEASLSFAEKSKILEEMWQEANGAYSWSECVTDAARFTRRSSQGLLNTLSKSLPRQIGD